MHKCQYKNASRPFITLFCLIILVVLTGCASRKIVVHQINEKEANEIIVYLGSRGINAGKTQSTADTGGGRGEVLWDITVPPEKYQESLSLLNKAGLPRHRGQNLLGIFKESGLVPSEMQQRIRYEAGLAEQISNTIRKIDGVLDAEVQISFPKEDPLAPPEDKKKITASVYVKHTGVLDDPNTHLITKIKRLVTASITGLDYDNVTVIPDRARFAELPGVRVMSEPEERDYVRIWSVIVAKESVSFFRTIFFSFTILLLLFFIFFIWISWKIYPILKQHGGFKELFQLKPIVVVEKPIKKVKKKEKGEEKEEDEQEKEEGAQETEGEEEKENKEEKEDD